MPGFGTTGGYGNWNPQPLDTNLLMYYDQMARKGLSTLGSLAGGAIGGGLGGMKNADIVKAGGTVADDAPVGFFAGAKEGLFSEAGGDEYKRLQQMGKSADAFVKAMQMGDENWVEKNLGIHKEAFKTLGAQNKAAAVQGYMAKTAVDAEAQKQQYQVLLNQRMKDEAAQSAALQGLTADIITGRPNVGAMGANPEAAAADAGSDTLNQRFARAAAVRANQPGLASPQLDNTLRALATLDAAGAKGPSGVTFQEDPVTGKRFATYGNTISGSGVNPEKTMVAPKVYAVEGMPGHRAVVGANGQLRIIAPDKTPVKASPVLQSRIDMKALSLAAKAKEIAETQDAIGQRGEEAGTGFLHMGETLGAKLKRLQGEQDALQSELATLRSTGKAPITAPPVSSNTRTNAPGGGAGSVGTLQDFQRWLGK